ncbi:MAG: hypothetical protein VKO39_08710 [Cyanobacteriota bacterium]|nr:hypothetical protein [Cyanobacteriota bacterium]
MLFDWFAKKSSKSEFAKKITPARDSQTTNFLFNYSWIMMDKLAIGPMPRYSEDWLSLEKNGIKKRFSCCYTEEHIFSPIPPDWKSREVSLPDHRSQEELTSERLIFALNEAINLLNEDSLPVYLHCFAGQERSTLLATGLVSLIGKKDLFDGLAYVRQCYPRARPLYEHLDILERVIKTFKHNQD